MNRRKFLKSAGLIGASLGTYNLFCHSPGAEKPNIVLIFIDDLGWKDTGFMGSRYYETPNIDKLASRGMVFTNAYSNAPNCAPTRASLLTGLYTPRHHIFTVNSSARGKSALRKLIPIPNTTRLAPNFRTIASVLKEAGYVTGCFGKWHLGDDPDDGPRALGFDVNVGGNHLGHPKSYFSPYKNSEIEDGPAGEYLTDRLTDETLNFMERHRRPPFFVYLSHYTVHTPLQAKKELIAKYKTKTPDQYHNNPIYAAMIESMDQSVGRVLDKIDRLGLAGKTVVFFLSDNGGNGNVTSQAPLRGAKGMLYEGGIRVPMVVRWPGQVAEGTTCDTAVMTADLFSTILEMADVSIPPGIALDGESIVPLLKRNGTLKREAIYWHFPAYLEGSRKTAMPWRTTPAGAIRAGDWKLIEFFEDGTLELYDLKSDLSEEKNLAQVLPERTKELHEKLIQWRRELNAPVPTTPNPGYNPDKMNDIKK